MKKGVAYAVIGALLWSSGGIFIKLTDAPAIFIACARSFFAFLFFLPALRLREIRLTKDLVLLILFYSYTLISFVLANKMTTAANAIILQYTAPVWLFLFYTFIKKQYDPKKLFPMLMIFTGLLVFLLEPASGTSALGNFIAMTSGFAFAFVAYFSSKVTVIRPGSLISLCNFFTFLFALPFVAQPVAIIKGLSPAGWLGIILLGTVQIGLGYVFYLMALRKLHPLDVSILCLIEPILNPVWVVLFLHEVPSVYALFASAVILSGIIINTIRERRQQKKPITAC
ncbi:MAG: DMT family transporter [Clostridia bacterium]